MPLTLLRGIPVEMSTWLVYIFIHSSFSFGPKHVFFFFMSLASTSSAAMILCDRSSWHMSSWSSLGSDVPILVRENHWHGSGLWRWGHTHSARVRRRPTGHPIWDFCFWMIMFAVSWNILQHVYCVFTNGCLGMRIAVRCAGSAGYALPHAIQRPATIRAADLCKAWCSSCSPNCYSWLPRLDLAGRDLSEYMTKAHVHIQFTVQHGLRQSSRCTFKQTQLTSLTSLWCDAIRFCLKAAAAWVLHLKRI